MTDHVEVHGARELRRALKKAGVSLKTMSKVHRAVGALVVSTAASTVPKRTGNLEGSIRSSPTTTKARVSSKLPYAGPVHWGWKRRHITANPFLSRAAQQSEPRWQALYLTEVDRVLEEVADATR